MLTYDRITNRYCISSWYPIVKIAKNQDEDCCRYALKEIEDIWSRGHATYIPSEMPDIDASGADLPNDPDYSLDMSTTIPDNPLKRDLASIFFGMWQLCRGGIRGNTQAKDTAIRDFVPEQPEDIVKYNNNCQCCLIAANDPKDVLKFWYKTTLYWEKEIGRDYISKQVFPKGGKIRWGML